MKEKIPEELLNDLCSRFLINLAKEIKDDPVQLFFYIELAHWYYTDFHSDEDSSLPKLDIKKFAIRIFRYLPFLKQRLGDIDQILLDWKEYKMRVPCHGAVLMNSECSKCVLAESYFSRGNWMFPRGKANKDESPLHCAIREVEEETGFNFTSLAREEDFLELKDGGNRMVRLYLVPGVPMDQVFSPKTRKEIRGIKWFDLDGLPTSKADHSSFKKFKMPAKHFFLVYPFVDKLRSWVAQRKQNMLRRNARTRGRQGVAGVPRPIAGANPLLLGNSVNTIMLARPATATTAAAAQSMMDSKSLERSLLGQAPSATATTHQQQRSDGVAASAPGLVPMGGYAATAGTLPMSGTTQSIIPGLMSLPGGQTASGMQPLLPSQLPRGPGDPPPPVTRMPGVQPGTLPPTDVSRHSVAVPPQGGSGLFPNPAQMAGGGMWTAMPGVAGSLLIGVASSPGQILGAQSSLSGSPMRHPRAAGPQDSQWMSQSRLTAAAGPRPIFSVGMVTPVSASAPPVSSAADGDLSRLAVRSATGIEGLTLRELTTWVLQQKHTGHAEQDLTPMKVNRYKDLDDFKFNTRDIMASWDRGAASSAKRSQAAGQSSKRRQHNQPTGYQNSSGHHMASSGHRPQQHYQPQYHQQHQQQQRSAHSSSKQRPFYGYQQ